MKHTKSMVYTPSDEARELLLFAVNDGNLYRRAIQPAIANLRRKAAKGTYDSAKAADLFYYIATTASDMYNREFGYRFDVTARWTAAVDMVEYLPRTSRPDIIKADLSAIRGESEINMIAIRQFGRPIVLSRHPNLWDNIANYMDDDHRETVHAELAPCAEEDFLARYLELDPDFEHLLYSEFSISVDL